MLGFLSRKEYEKEDIAELKWEVRGKIDVRRDDRDRKALKAWSVTAALFSLMS